MSAFALATRCVGFKCIFLSMARPHHKSKTCSLPASQSVHYVEIPNSFPVICRLYVIAHIKTRNLEVLLLFQVSVELVRAAQ